MFVIVLNGTLFPGSAINNAVSFAYQKLRNSLVILAKFQKQQWEEFEEMENKHEKKK